MPDSEPRKPIQQRTLSVGRNEIAERDPTLRIVPDAGTPFTFILIQKIVDIGSEARQDVPIQSPGIAARHARLTQEIGSYRIYDLTGKKGLLVNDEYVDTAVLRDNNRAPEPQHNVLHSW